MDLCVQQSFAALVHLLELYVVRSCPDCLCSCQCAGLEQRCWTLATYLAGFISGLVLAVCGTTLWSTLRQTLSTAGAQPITNTRTTLITPSSKK